MPPHCFRLPHPVSIAAAIAAQSNVLISFFFIALSSLSFFSALLSLITGILIQNYRFCSAVTLCLLSCSPAMFPVTISATLPVTFPCLHGIILLTLLQVFLTNLVHLSKVCPKFLYNMYKGECLCRHPPDFHRFILLFLSETILVVSDRCCGKRRPAPPPPSIAFSASRYRGYIPQSSCRRRKILLSQC